MADNVEIKVEKKANSKSRMPKMSVTNWLVMLAVVLLAGAAFYFWQDAQDARNQTPEAIAERNEEESQRVIQQLGEILQISTDQEPTVARIEDADVLREANPDFYTDAQENDYLVLYPQRAIIYREDENKIVNIAPIINTADLQPQTDDESTGDSDDSQN